MQLPVNPPLLPMLAKRVGELPAGRGLDLRAEVGRLSRAGLSRRRRDSHPEPRREAAQPLLPRAHRSRSRRSCPQRCVLDGEIVVAQRRRARFRSAAAAHPPGGLAREAALQGDPGVDRVLGSAVRGRSRSCAPRRSASVARALETLLASAQPPLHLTPATTDRAIADRLVQPLRGRRARRRDGQAAVGHYEPNKRVDAQGEARARVRLRGRRLSLAQERAEDARRLAAARALRRRGRAPARRRVRELHRQEAPRARRVPRALPRERARRSPVEALGRGRDGSDASGQRVPGAKSRWSQGKDLSWEPLRPELVVEVAYDHMQGTRFRHTAQFRRWRTDKKPTRLHLRAARGRAAGRARGDLRATSTSGAEGAVPSVFRLRCREDETFLRRSLRAKRKFVPGAK